MSIRRRWKDKFNTLAVLCRDQIGYLFVCTRGENEIRTLEAFRRIKNEIKWRRDEDASWTGLEHFVLAEHVVRLLGGEPAASSGERGVEQRNAISSHSASDVSTCDLPITCREKKGQVEQRDGSEGAGSVTEDDGDDIAAPFELMDDYRR